MNPLLKHEWFCGKRYRWYVNQAEYASDVMFRGRDALKELYVRLLDHAAVNFSAQDILGFLGRSLHGNFQGEVVTTCRKDRWPGARVKHRVKNNWLKMYDKFGQVLRIETVINQPREFKVRRWRMRQGKYQQVWCPMNKGVANLYQYQTSAHSANMRYLEALSVVDDPSPAYQQVETLTQPCVVKKRSYAGFNPARRDDVRLFQAVLQGDYLLHGFRNANIRVRLYGEVTCPRERRRQSGMVGRLIKRLHARGLLAKVPHTRRWLVTQHGHQILGACIRLYYHGLATAA